MLSECLSHATTGSAIFAAKPGLCPLVPPPTLSPTL